MRLIEGKEPPHAESKSGLEVTRGRQKSTAERPVSDGSVVLLEGGSKTTCGNRRIHGDCASKATRLPKAPSKFVCARDARQSR